MGLINAIGSYFSKITGGWEFGTQLHRFKFKGNVEMEGSASPTPKTHSFQDKDGTIAHLDDIPSIDGLATEIYVDNAIALIATDESGLLAHLADTNNPHGVTKAQVGLGNVDNTSDLDKPVSTAQATADNAILTSANSYSDGLITQLINGAPADANTLKELNDKILAVQAIIGSSSADGDTVVNTVSELLAVFATFPEGVDLVTLLAGKVNVTDIYNALDCIISGKVLDARQGKVLNDAITAINVSLALKANNSEVVHLLGAETITGLKTFSGALTAGSFVKSGGTASQFLKADGSVDSNTYLTSAVTTFSGGTTGLTPSVASFGAIVLSGTLVLANGGTGATTASGARTNLGATTIGSNLFTATNPSAVTFLRANADNTISWLDAVSFRTAIGAGTSTVTPSALTKVDDTNVTLTLGGTPSTSLLQGVSLTLGWTGTLADSRIASAATWNAKQAALSGTGFVKSTAGVISYDTSTYLTSISGITAGGELSGTYPNPTLLNSAVIGKVLTGVNITGGSVSATDSILTAFGKLQNQINGLIGGSIYQSTWNASTNTPALTTSVGTKGYYYIVSVAGATNLNGITDWKVGDWAIYDGASWQKVDNTDAVSSVNGFTGAVSLTTANVSEVTNLYYTDARSRSAISLTTTGNSGASTYSSATGVLNIPTYTLAGLGGAPSTGGTGYIQNQIASAQSANMWISGTGKFGGNLVVGNNQSLRGINSFGTEVPLVQLQGTLDNTVIYPAASGRFIAFSNYAQNQNNLLIEDSGAATFASSVSATSLTATGLTSNYIPKVGIGGLLGNSVLQEVSGNFTANNPTSQYFRIRETTTGNLNTAMLQVDATYAKFIADYNTTAIPMALRVGDVDRVVILPSGNVGIGTPSPAAKLTVNTSTNENVAIGSLASIPTGRTLILQTSSSGGSIETYSSVTSGYVNTLINPNGGNVGIGTTDGSYGMLTVAKSAASSYVISSIRNIAGGAGGGVQGTQLNFYGDGGYGVNTPTSFIQSTSNDGGSSGQGSLRFGNFNGSSLVEAMRIASNGNVLIGTTTDNGNKLRVNGTGYFDDNIFIPAGKYLGFNTSTYITPEDNIQGARIKTGGSIVLESSGAVKLSNLAGTGTRMVIADLNGNLSTQVIPSSGGSTNLSYTASSTDGVVASDTGTDATIPLADGTYAGLLAPADYNVLSNLEANTTDKTVWNNGHGGVLSNVSFGSTSLSNNTTGAGNSVFGYSSLVSNSTGSFNTALGASSLATSNGSQNTAVGYSSLTSSTASGNTAVGYGSLANNVSGTANAIMGDSSFFGLTSGSNNVGIGASIGKIADGTTNATAIDNSVVIGNLAKVLANSQTNQIVIGYNATGNGSNTTTIGNASTTDTYLKGVVRGGSFISTQVTPTAKTATATLTIAEILTDITTVTSTTAVTLTLPTGTLTDAGVQSGTLAVNESFEWTIINLGTSSGAVTMAAGTGHTYVGATAVAIGTSATFRTRKTAANTFVTYRI